MNKRGARRVLALAESGDEAALRDAGSDIAPAIEWFLEHDRAAAARLAGALADYWIREGRVDEGRALTERVVEATIVSAAAYRDIAMSVPGALVAASELAFRQGDDPAAAKRARDAVRAAMLIEDRATAARARHMLALAAERDDVRRERD